MLLRSLKSHLVYSGELEAVAQAVAQAVIAAA
jgi:hypothetical protein